MPPLPKRPSAHPDEAMLDATGARMDAFARDDALRKAAAEAAGFDPDGDDDESHLVQRSAASDNALSVAALDGVADAAAQVGKAGDGGSASGKGGAVVRAPYVRRGALRVELKKACLEWDNGTELLTDASLTVRGWQRLTSVHRCTTLPNDDEAPFLWLGALYQYTWAPFRKRSASLSGCIAEPHFVPARLGRVLSPRATLRHHQVRDGELCMVVGTTGSGKSGLLSAIIGELEPVSGKVASRGAIAYVSQVAWIQNATLKDNVLFGKPWDEKRYAAIIEVPWCPWIQGEVNGRFCRCGSGEVFGCRVCLASAAVSVSG